MLASFLNNWRVSLLALAALAVAGVFFYLWAYDRGKHACESGIDKASLQAQEQTDEANRQALGAEIEATRKREQDRALIDNIMEDSHAAGDDDPVAPVLQHLFDGLRTLENQDR